MTISSYYRVLAEIKEKYDIDVVLAGERMDMDIAYKEAKPTKARDYIEFFLHKELLVYSEKTLRKSKIGRIVVCEKLASRGKCASGVADMKVIIVPGRKSTIYLDISRDHYNLNCGTVHHEIFHAIDHSDDFWRYIDHEWPKLNPSEFEYGSIELNHAEECERPGFVSRYSTSAVHEDKAEVYKYMMVDYAGVEKRARQDIFLKSKVERMKDLLKKFSPQFDEDFWEKRRKLSAPLY
ncbi:MAG: hypothetical protein IT343_08270 [Candidatus Melainabacteria bacterium]|jgi:hypothetical protein|nr:hypothetical protein [Candidatus Melainabacteria bacterium]